MPVESEKAIQESSCSPKTIPIRARTFGKAGVSDLSLAACFAECDLRSKDTIGSIMPRAAENDIGGQLVGSGGMRGLTKTDVCSYRKSP